MDLSTAVSAMSAGVPQNGGGAGAVACPVCTLYLREGISLQKHLDTHPKEQVIEALIRASSAGAGASALLSQNRAPQPPSQPQTPVLAPTPTPALPPGPATPQQQQPPAASPGPHVPHAQSPYPIGPIFECPPINAMIPPPQFASFSYQQFVNNGTMMIPAQYAMAQAQAAPTSQMMQMLYSPYGMYHQQQIPTVQMISAPPMMPTSTATLPTTVPAVTPRMRPATSTSNVAPVNETTASPPRPVSCAQQLPSPLAALSAVQQPQQPEPEEEPQSQQQNLVLEPTQIVREIESGPDSILPDLEMPPSPEPPSTEVESEQNVIHAEQQIQNSCSQVGQRHAQQYQREDSRTLINNTSDDNADDDKTERILPDIEDNDEIESLLVRQTEVVEIHKETEIQVEQSIEHMETSVEESTRENDVENIPNNKEEISKNLEDKTDDVEVIEERIEPHDLTMSVDKTRIPNIKKPEIEQLSRLIVNMESEFNNVELSSKDDEEVLERSQEVIENALSPEPAVEKHPEEDEATNASYNKTTSEPTECKIIVSHEDTDVSSVSSSDSLRCDMEIQKITTPSYQYKYSQSCPTSPVSKKKFWRSLSRVSLRYDLGRSNENICSYPVGFEATTLEDYLKDNYNDEDMELEQSSGMIVERARSHTPLSTSMTGASVLKARRSKIPNSPLSMRSSSSYCHMEDEEEEEEEDSEAESCGSCHSNEKDDEEDDEEDQILMDSSAHQMIEDHERDEKKQVLHVEESKATVTTEIVQQQRLHHPQDQPADFRTQCLMADHYSANQFPLDHHPTSQQQSSVSVHHETYPLSNSEISQNLLNMSECADPTTSADSKSFSSSSKSSIQKPSTELLNISEDAHAGPMNVFEFDGLQILVPSTFISESSQKAVSGTSQQSMSSSENGAGNDEEVKSVNMRADETMPPRGELSEQESNGCTEPSAWQLYMGQESSRMSTSYDLMARESWEESEGSDHEENNAGPLLDSRSLATHFTSSLFLDRDRKTPTRRVFKCSHCPEVFECPKERRVHSTMVHKEAGPSGCSNDNMDNQSELRDLKLLDGRANVFDDLFVPSGLHVQQTYLQHHQQPLLHQLQPPQHSSSAKSETDAKIDSLHLSTVNEVTCNMCNQRFSSEKSLQIHQRRMHMSEPSKRIRENAKCQICSEEFTSVASFNLHLKIHPLECGQCGKYFYRKQNFKLHMKRHLGIKPFPCTVCEKAFLTKQKLDEHTNGHTGNAPVKCNLCNETFRRYSNLTQHKNRHHLNIKKKLKDYICHCGEVFHTKKKLAWHKETHDEKPKACTYCNERFIHMASLTRHMRRAHNRRFVPDAQRENENVECPICKCIYLRSSLAVHMRVHNGERPYECQVCSKAFSTKWNLQLHKWTHAARSTKPFKCNQCSAAFYRHSDYTAHMNSHRNVRPYTCNYCGAQFIRKYNCLRHVKEHEENKAYTCDVCSKTFHRSYYLKEHLRVHSGARPYTCHICGKSSSTKSNHNKHVRIHHAREPVNTEN